MIRRPRQLIAFAASFALALSGLLILPAGLASAATDVNGSTASPAATINTTITPVVVFSPPTGEVGVAYTAQPTASGGIGGYTWAVSGGKAARRPLDQGQHRCHHRNALRRRLFQRHRAGHRPR